MMRKVFFAVLALTLVSTFGIAQANLDDFNGPNLDSMWTVRDPGGKSAISFAGGEMVLDLAAGADMYIRGTDAGVMFLMDPPDVADFSMEMKLNVATNDGIQSPACQVGIVLFNEVEWGYTAWGPYNAGVDIRLEDCLDASYRWRAETGIGVDPGDVAIDDDVWLMVIKTGDDLEFLTKGNAGDPWISGGVDSKLGPNYTPGNYQVGIIAKSWGGSVNSVFEIDFFDIPEISTTAVAPAGKLITTWSSIKD